MLSMPPATTTSFSPSCMLWAANIVAGNMKYIKTVRHDFSWMVPPGPCKGNENYPT